MRTGPGERDFLDAALTNPIVREVLTRAARLNLPDWYLAAGCLFQTVWNVLDGRDPQHGIADYDLIYHDDRDVSWEAENAVIRRCAALFDDLFAFVVRPNPVIAPRHVYEAKAARWRTLWPRLVVLPWPADADADPAVAAT